MTFADGERIEFSESLKRNELLQHKLKVQRSTELLDPSGSNSHTFGRRSRT